VPDTLTAYDRLIALFNEHRVDYRIIDHPSEGRTEIVSAMRGHPVAHAAKCLIIMAKLGKKVTRYILAVVPGDARVDLGALKAVLAPPTSASPPPTSRGSSARPPSARSSPLRSINGSSSLSTLACWSNPRSTSTPRASIAR
jgi:hypothetical protein